MAEKEGKLSDFNWSFATMVSRRSSHSMTSCAPADHCSIGGLYFWWFRRDSLHVTPHTSSTIRHTIEIFRVLLSNIMFRKSVWCSAKLFDITLHQLCIRCTILHYAESFHATLHHLCVRRTIRHCAEPFHAALHHLRVRCTIRRYAEPFHATLHCFYVRCTIWHYAELFHATRHRLCVRCATRHYPVPFDATLHRLCTVLQMSAKLFVIELVHFTISCSNSTWATGPFIIWLDYSCLGCSVSWRKTKPSIIWPCHSFISYPILQLILRPALYLLIYLISLYFWWWRPPIKRTSTTAFTKVCIFIYYRTTRGAKHRELDGGFLSEQCVTVTRCTISDVNNNRWPTRCLCFAVS